MLILYLLIIIIIIYIILIFLKNRNLVFDIKKKRILKLKSLNYYYLTNNNIKRKIHINYEFKDYKLIEINPYPDIGSKNKSIASGFSRIYDIASKQQNYDQPFQPFVILEDDVKKFRKFPDNLIIPEDTDILFIGLSKCAWDGKKWTYHRAYKNIDKDIIRVKNMLSLHGLIICSVRGLLTMQKCMMEGFFLNRDVDIFTSEIQPYLNIYALKRPLVYQYGKIGGVENYTKVTIEDSDDVIMPEEWINKQNISILTIN